MIINQIIQSKSSSALGTRKSIVASDAFSVPRWAPPRYPAPKSPPSGRGLGGRSRRSPAGSVASLRKVLRFSVSAVPRPCFSIFRAGLAPLVLQQIMYQAITKWQVPSLQFFQRAWNHAFSMILIIRKIQNARCQPSVNLFQNSALRENSDAKPRQSSKTVGVCFMPIKKD